MFDKATYTGLDLSYVETDDASEAGYQEIGKFNVAPLSPPRILFNKALNLVRSPRVVQFLSTPPHHLHPKFFYSIPVVMHSRARLEDAHRESSMSLDC